MKPKPGAVPCGVTTGPEKFPRTRRFGLRDDRTQEVCAGSKDCVKSTGGESGSVNSSNCCRVIRRQTDRALGGTVREHHRLKRTTRVRSTMRTVQPSLNMPAEAGLARSSVRKPSRSSGASRTTSLKTGRGSRARTASCAASIRATCSGVAGAPAILPLRKRSPTSSGIHPIKPLAWRRSCGTVGVLSIAEPLSSKVAGPGSLGRASERINGSPPSTCSMSGPPGPIMLELGTLPKLMLGRLLQHRSARQEEKLKCPPNL